jgi:hypothetical protein
MRSCTHTAGHVASAVFDTTLLSIGDAEIAAHLKHALLLLLLLLLLLA